MLNEYDDMKLKIERFQQLIKDFNLFAKQFYHIFLSVKRKRRVKTQRIPKAKQGKPMLLSKYAVWRSKNSSFIKEQEANGITGSLVKTLSNIPILGPILF